MTSSKAISLGVFLLVPSILHAQGSTPALTEISVFGTRQAYQGKFSNLETPQGIQVIDAKAIENAGARDLNQILDLSASVARQNNFGGLWNSFSIRGFVGDENLPSAYLVNGFNAGRGFGGPRDASGIESLVVLKGPAAALIGRGEPGGTVNIVTKRPGFSNQSNMRVGAGSFNSYRADVDVEQVIKQDVAAVRIVGFYEDSESFRNTVETVRYGASPSIAIKAGDATNIVYEMEFLRQEVPFDRGIVAIQGKVDAVSRKNFLGEPSDGPLETEVLGHQIELQHDFNQSWGLLLGAGYRETSLAGFSSEAELGSARQTLYRDGRTLTRQRRSRDYDAQYWVLRAEVNGEFTTGQALHRIVIGTDTDEFKNEQIVTRYRAPLLSSNPSRQRSYAIDVFNPLYGQYPFPVTSPLTNREEIQESSGFYVQDQITLTERVQLRLGARHDRFTQRINNRLNNRSSRQSETRVSPQIGLVYAQSDDQSIYLTYSEGFRPLSGTDFAGSAFDPNVSTSLEAGLKFSLKDGLIAGTLSVFQIEQENILGADPANAGFSVAAGEAKSQGVELDLQGTITDSVQLYLSLAYIDARMVNDLLDFNFGVSIKSGDRLLNVPKYSMSALLIKELPLFGKPASVGGGLLYTGKRLGEVATDFTLPDYLLTRVFLNYEWSANVSVRAEVDNLFDETYYTNSFSQFWIQPGTPRSFRLSLTAGF